MFNSTFKRFLLLLAMFIPLTAFAQKSRTYSPVLVLNQLHAFQAQRGYDGFSAGFGLTKFDDDSALAARWSRDPQFLNALYPFATANGGGSFYAIWRMRPGDNLSRSPVIFFGDDGTEYVVARNARELISLVMLDTDNDNDAEHEADEDFSAFTRPGSGYSSNLQHHNFAVWVQQNTPRTASNASDDHDLIIKRAQRLYEPSFKQWKNKYVQRRR